MGILDEALAATAKGRGMVLIGECHFIVSRYLFTKSDRMEDVIHHLNKAVESFQAARDNSGLGKALVVLARIKIDKAMAKQAYKLFQEERPYSNEAGMMDALQIVVELSSQELEFEDCFALIRGIEMTFRVIEKLFKQNTPEDKARAQLYYRFFGLYQNSAKPTHFEIHPKERPRCIEVIKDFFLGRKEKKEYVIEREKNLMCISLSCFLIGRMKEWLYIVESAFRKKVQHHTQCKTYLQGIECEDLCPYMHRVYNQTEAFEALKLFVWDVSLSYIIQTGTDMIKRMDIAELSAEVKNLVEEETKYDSCDRLLGFLMPLHHHPRLLSENAAVVTQVVALLVSNVNMRNQVKKYLEPVWINPSLKEKKYLNKERSRYTDWVLRTEFFASLLKLDLDVTQYCQDLEQQLIIEAPKWLVKRSSEGKLPYALFADYNKNPLVVKYIVSIYLDALKWLKIKADPMESIIKFTQFVKVLSQRDRPALLPPKATMLFWLEVFVSLSLFLLAKISSHGTAKITGGGIHFILPATYLAAIHFVDSSFKEGSLLIQEIVHRYRPQKNINKLLLDRLQKIVGLVSGFKSRTGLLQLLFTVTRDDYLAAERCLVLTLVVLVNVGLLLPADFEDHIMKSIITLQLPDSASKRLKMTLQAVTGATGLSDIAAILQDLLHERGDEHLLDCVWSWDSVRRQGVQYRVLTDLSTFPKGFKSAGNMDTGILADSKPEVEDDLSDEEEMSPERFQKELEESEIEKKENAAARVIQRFFKHITFRYHITGLKMRALMQEMLEVFVPFAVTEKFCGVCGLNLLPPETDQSVTGLSYHAEREYWDTSESPSSSVADDRTASRSVETLQRHRTSPEHNEKNIQFETFKRLYYRDNMRLLLHEFSLFIGIHKLRCPDMKTTAYADVSLDIDRLLSEMDNVKTILQNIMGNRSWEKIEELRRALFILYQDYLGGRVVIVRKFHEHKVRFYKFLLAILLFLVPASAPQLV